MVNWSKLSKKIPTKVQIKAKVWYTIVFVESFPDDAVGEMDFNTKQIRIKLGQSDKEKVLTYLHEICHAFSDENGIGLTEKQVTKLEKTMFYYLLKGTNIFL